MISSCVAPPVDSPLKPIVAAIKKAMRWVAGLNGASQYFLLDPIPVSQSFNLRFTATNNEPASQQYIFSGTGIPSLYFRFNAGGTSRFRFTDANSNTVTLSGPVAEQGRPYRFEVRVRVDRAQLWIDGQLVVDLPLAYPIAIGGTWAHLASAGGTSSFMRGRLYGVEVEDVAANGDVTPLLTMPINEGYFRSDVENHDPESLGSEVWSWNGEITEGTQWGSLHVEDVRCLENGALEDQQVYLVEAALLSIPTGGAVQLRVGTSGSQVMLDEATPRVMYLVMVAGDRLSAVEASASGTVVGATLDVSVRKAPGWYENDIIRNLATPLGGNLWANGDLLSAPVVAQYETLHGGYTLATTKPLVVEFEVRNLPAGGQFAARFGGLFKNISANGVYKYIHHGTSGNQMLFQERTEGLSAGVSITNIQVREAEGWAKLVNGTQDTWEQVA